MAHVSVECAENARCARSQRCGQANLLLSGNSGVSEGLPWRDGEKEDQGNKGKLS